MIKKILLISLFFRIFIALLGEHGDVINYMWWAKDLYANGLNGFYERSIANAMPPTYPPVISYIFWLTSYAHRILWLFFWNVNLRIDLFPSNLIFWLESDKGWYFVNKLPSILADTGMILILYKLVKGIKGKKEALAAALIFAFNPVFWYNSGLWGQTDSIYGIFLLLSVYFLYKNNRYISVLFYFLSVLTKPTAFFVAPVFIFFWLRRINLKQLILNTIMVICITLLLYYPFHPDGTIFWVYDFYIKSLGGELDYIVANAFNLWGLVFGFDNVSVNTKFLGIPAQTLGYLLFILSTGVLFITWGFRKYNIKTMLIMSAIVSFLAFMFLPMMHERYFYPVLLFLTPTAAIYFNERKPYYLLSAVHFINLYHFWWVPRVELFVVLFSNRLMEIILILSGFAILIWYIRRFKQVYV